jgi:hypothetical protein
MIPVPFKMVRLSYKCYPTDFSHFFNRNQTMGIKQELISAYLPHNIRFIKVFGKHKIIKITYVKSISFYQLISPHSISKHLVKLNQKAY